MFADKHRGIRTHYPHLVGKNTIELEEEKLKRKLHNAIDAMTLDQLKSLDESLQ